VQRTLVVDARAGLDIQLPGVDPEAEGVEPSAAERVEEGLADLLDLAEWRMPTARDYLWYAAVYVGAIALSVYVIVRNQELWAYVLWGGYLVIMVLLASLVVRSFNYRRGTYSKGFLLSTLDVQRAVEGAVEDVGLVVDGVETPKGAFLRPVITSYRFRLRDYTVVIEGRPHLSRKVVRVGRLSGESQLEEARRLCLAMDQQVDAIVSSKRNRTLFKDADTA